MRQYVTTQTAFSLSLLFLTVLFEHYLTGIQLFLLSAFIIISLINSGAILDQRRWNFFLEFLRALIVMTGIGVVYKNTWILSCLITIFIVLVWYFRPMQRRYIQLLYHK